jgi:glucosamine-6-phosphate deaminase
MESIMEKINRGLTLPKGAKILHTSPHHDDEMLAYFPMLPELLKRNENIFLYITSGFNSVTDHFILKALYATPEHLIDYPPEKDTFIDLVAIAFGIPDLHSLREKVHWLKTEYFPNKNPENPDIEEIKVLKGTIRELEAEKMLSQLGVAPSRVHHLRAQFYDGGDPENDANVLKDLIDELKPEMITIAYDAKDQGHKTHHRSFQVILRAIELSRVKPKIWGYRNVWSRFSLDEANLFIPVSGQELEAMNQAFLSCYLSQKIPAFPANDFQGPFSKLSEKIMREQYDQLRKILGDDFFKNHPDPRIRTAEGFIFIQELFLFS